MRSPLVYLTGFVTEDRAKHEFENGVSGTSTKSKNLLGVRSYVQYSITPKLQAFNGQGGLRFDGQVAWAPRRRTRRRA